jgi:thiamine biosynthesis lipoprotein
VTGIPVAIYRRKTHPALLRRSIPVMGTIAEVAVVHRDVAVAQAAIDAAFDELRWVERTMTRFTNTSDIGRANIGASRGAVAVDSATALVVAEGLRWAAATHGAYDPAVGGAVKLWDVLNRHAPPPADAVARLAGRSLYHAIEVGTTRGSPALVYHDSDASLDLGAVAKGYAVDRAAAALRNLGIVKGVVIAGGDLYAIGTAPDDEPWTVGIRDPHDARATVGSLRVSDAAVATSGTYVRFFKYRGVRYHHLMDPMIAAPRRTPVESFTIRADSCMHADVATTALFGMPLDGASRMLARLAPGAHIESVLL